MPLRAQPVVLWSQATIETTITAAEVKMVGMEDRDVYCLTLSLAHSSFATNRPPDVTNMKPVALLGSIFFGIAPAIDL
jgi:hypothetical protein